MCFLQDPRGVPIAFRPTQTFSGGGGWGAAFSYNMWVSSGPHPQHPQNTTAGPPVHRHLSAPPAAGPGKGRGAQGPLRRRWHRRGRPQAPEWAPSVTALWGWAAEGQQCRTGAVVLRPGVPAALSGGQPPFPATPAATPNDCPCSLSLLCSLPPPPQKKRRRKVSGTQARPPRPSSSSVPPSFALSVTPLCHDPHPTDVQCLLSNPPSLHPPPAPGCLPAEVHEEGMNTQDFWSPCGTQGLAGAHAGVRESRDPSRRQPAKGLPHVAPN